MLSKLNISKFIKFPLSTLKRVVYKLFIAPIKYAKGGGYDAQRYWHDRLSKYGTSILGAGDEGISEEENLRMYELQKKVLFDLLEREGVVLSEAKVLEIGCGNGFYTQCFFERTPKKFLGIDITDAMFPYFEKKFSGFTFEKKDITEDSIEEKFDIIVMIDVTLHIVEKKRFNAAMTTIKGALSDNGVFIVTPVETDSKKNLFYSHNWALNDFKENFSGYTFSKLHPFRYSSIVTIKKALPA